MPDLAGLTGQLRSLSKVDFTTLGASTKSLQNLAAGLSSLKGASNISIPKIDAKNVKSAVNAIQKFQEIDAVKMQPAITGVEKISSTMNALNGMNFKDSKITNVINSLSRLAAADMSGFDTSKMGEIIKSIDSLNDIRDVSSSVNRFVGSLARLANAGGKADQSAAGLETLGKNLRKVVNGMLFTVKPSESINMFVQSISRLANAGDKTGKTASQLENLATEVKKFFTAMQDAPRISENTLRMTEALGQLAAASGKVGTSTNTVVNSFNKLSSIGSGLGQVLGSGFMISWNILDGFVQKMSKENNAGLTGWEQLGTAISDAMNGAFGRISFSKIATTIATGLNGAFQTLAAWTKNFNWDGLVTNISSGINTFIGKFKWKENGTSLNTFITNLLNALVDIAGETDWESFGRGIGLFLSQIDWGSHLKDLATVLLDVLGGIFSGLGETTAGKFVVAFAGVGLVSKADTLVSSILVAMGKLPTGTSATATLLGTALSKIATAFSTSTLGTKTQKMNVLEPRLKRMVIFGLPDVEMNGQMK